MGILDIPPHPRRTTRLALAALALIAVAGFAGGFLRQLDTTAPAPPPTAANPGGPAIAEATPAPAQQVADFARKPRRPADDAEIPNLDVPPAAADPTSATAPAQSATAADASATAAETPAPAQPAPAAPRPEDPPT